MKNKKNNLNINISINEKGLIEIKTNIQNNPFYLIGVLETIKQNIINSNKKEDTFSEIKLSKKDVDFLSKEILGFEYKEGDVIQLSDELIQKLPA